jgi:radical SAM superfamily enzyme
LFGVADPALLIAPKWGLAKSSVQAHLEREFLRRGVRQGAQWCG